MKIQPFTLSSGYTNTYAVSYGKDVYIIDAPDSIAPLIAYIEREGLDPKGVILTHGHFDHILGLGELRRAFPDLPIYISHDDICFLEDGGKLNKEILSGFGRMDREIELLNDLPDDLSVLENDIWKFRVIRTPGHTPGSICLYSAEDNVLFSGDTLFRRSIGRTDFGGSYPAILESLDKISSIKEDTLVLPGHGDITTIKDEKKYNPYLR